MNSQYQNQYNYKYCVQHNYSLKYIDPNKYVVFQMISAAAKIACKISIIELLQSFITVHSHLNKSVFTFKHVKLPYIPENSSYM